MYQLNNVKSLQTLIAELLKLKDLVKCPICLDIVKNPVQVRCTHTFCSDCLISFQNASTSKILLCPLCRKTIRAKKSTNHRVEHLAKFVQDVSDKLKTVFDCEGLDASTVNRLTSKLKTLQKHSKEDSTSSNQNTASTNTIPATVYPRKAREKQKSSLQRTEVSEEPLLYKSILNRSPSNRDILSEKNRSDTFDQFAQTSVPTRYKNIKTYDRKKTSKAPIVTYNKLIDFEDGSNRMKIIQWLTDSKNCFGRMTQTQQEPLEQDLTQAFNFPSISQDDLKYMKTYTESLKKIRKSRVKLASKSKHERRAHSLDFAIGSYAHSSVVKRHSLACETPDFEERHIEEVESQSDINDVMHLIEEDYLNTLEKDMNLSHEEDKNTKIKGDLLTGQSIKEGTGWSRIKKIKRAINKLDRKPKKLDVSFTPVCSNSRGKAGKEKRNSAEKEAVILLNRLPMDRLNKNIASIQTRAHKVYNLNEIESYIEGNILKYTGNISDENVFETSKENVIEKPNVNLTAQSLPENVSEEKKSCNKDINTSAQELNVINAATLLSLQSNSQANENNLMKEKSPHKVMNDIEENTQRAVSHNNVFLLPVNNAGARKKENDPVLEEDLFMQPTQITANNDDQVTDGLEEKLEAIFNTQSEKETSKIHDESNILQNKQLTLHNKINLAITMMNDFNKVFALSLNECSSSKEMPSHFQNIKLLCNEIHQLLEVDKENRTIKSNVSLPETPDLMDTTLRAKNISIATTQTVHLDFHDIGIQTDHVVSHGFQISSTASFKTQPQGFDAETQTDPFSCANCNSIVQTRSISFQRMPSEVLIDDRDLIKHITDKYEFTQSLDNVQFDTQDMVKSLAKEKSQNKLQLMKKSPVSRLPNEYEFTQSLDDVQINTCDILQGANGSSVLFKDTNNQRVGDVISSKSSSQSTNKYKLNESLDDINFNTNDITAEHEKRSQSNKNVNLKPAKCSAESSLTFSISTEAQDQETKPINKSLQPPNTSRRFKRIRTPMSDSESDSENPKKVAKQGNVHVRDDLSINFISESSSSEGTATNGIKKDDTFALSIGGSENIDYDEYLEKIMKKYDKEIPCSTPKHAKLKNDNRKPDSRKRKASQEVVNAPCGKKVNKEEPLIKIKQKDNLSESLFSNGSCPVDNAKNIKAPPPLNDTVVNSMVDEFKKHLQESDGEPGLGNKDVQQSVNTTDNRVKSNVKTDGEVTVLQNILLKPKDVSTTHSKLPYDLEEELAKMEQKAEVKSETSDDMFASESEDLDLVETTPQKRSPPRFISQSFQKIKEQKETRSFPPPIESPTNIYTCLDLTLPPPIEFQDDNENVENIPDLDVTLISHIPAMDVEEDDDTLKKSSLLDENIDSSPPPSEKLLHLSPIRRERKVLNPLDVVHNSRFSPLDIVIKPQQQKLIATSTPKQKSILNYIRTSQQSCDTSVYTIKSTQDTPEKKPCIACTRLTKEQVIAISTLTNRKLATYSSSFHPGVTHMIVSVNERNCVEDHTIKFVSAVASGIWVLGFNWIQECIAQNRIVQEEPFEALDVSGIAGPRTARLSGSEKFLLKGFRIYAAPPFLSTTRKDVEDIIRMLGGEVVSAPEDLLNKKSIRIIITEARVTQDFELYESWLERVGVVTVDIEWMSRSVGQYQLLSLRPFALCSDDMMADLGYPPELLVDTPFSFSQSMYSS